MKIDTTNPDHPTLRDQIAMHALSGLLASGYRGDRIPVAMLAYDIADSMLEARKK